MLFFDIDDTLLDYRSSQDLAARKFADQHRGRLLVDQDSFVEFWHRTSLEAMEKYLAGRVSFQEQRRLRVRVSLSGVRDDSEADFLFSKYHSAYESSWSLFPECFEALELLKQRKLGVITNGDPIQQRRKLERLGISSYFDSVITPADAGEAKPSRKIFEFAATSSGYSPDQCWYVGDDYDRDYVAAKKLGWNAVWLNRDLKQPASREQCASLVEFANLVLAL